VAPFPGHVYNVVDYTILPANIGKEVVRDKNLHRLRCFPSIKVDIVTAGELLAFRISY